jgi:hypothetical protein
MRHILLLFPLLFTSCATDALYTTGGAATGAAIGGVASDGDPLITGLSAAGGVLASEFVQSQVRNARENARTEGYQKGRSDAVKQQYWIIQNQQKHDNQPEEKFRYVPIHVPGTNTNGIQTVPSTHYIRVIE